MGCTTDVAEGPEMVDVGDIEVTFSVNGNEVSTLDLESVSHTIKVDVALNNDNLYWNVTADQEWCQIVEEAHRGSGSFTLVINANDSFDARETATITFKAGEYESRKLSVAHNGNVFVVDQVYAASTKSANGFTTKVKTRDAGEAWSLECDSWITATKGTVTTTEEGDTITEITIAWEANSDESRYGTVALVKDGNEEGDAAINVWQYGTELTYDEEGFLLLEAQDAAPLELRVPKQTIKDIVMPSWVEYTIQENSDDTVSYMLQFAGNPSDANHIRVTELELSLLSGAANIKLPIIKQSYYPMEGLMTGPGLALFAKTWNEGGDVSQWYVDGVPTIVADMDLTEVKEWVSIGTAERPWTGEFNGNGTKLINLTASKPLFGVVQDATIKGIVFDATSSFSVVGSYSGTLHLAPLAAEIRNTTIENCTNNATVSIDASITDSNAIYIAGLVGRADATSSVKLCSNIGSVSVPNSATVSGNNTLYIGGLVAYNEGTIEDSFNNAPINSGIQVIVTYLGGVVGYTTEGSKVRNSQNAAAINYSAKRGTTTSIGYIGGVLGVGNGEITGNTNEGDITSTSDVQDLYIGGVASYLYDENGKFENNTQGNIADITSEGKVLHLYAGGLAGYVVEDYKLNLDYTKDSGTTLGNIHITDISSDLNNAIICAGGLFGCVDCNITLTAPTWNGTIESKYGDDIYCPTKIGGIIALANGVVNITDATISGNLTTAHVFPTKTSQIYNNSMGGVVGECNNSITIKNSNNTAELYWDRAGSKQRVQYNSAAVGGIVGRINEGTALFENCHNKVNIYNGCYNNASYDANAGANCSGGIVGCYGQTKYGVSGTLTVKNCSNQGELRAMRGFAGGIVGFAKNATIEECSFSVGRFATNDLNPHAGGIIAGAYDSTIKDCTVKVDVHCQTGGSCSARGGGIVGFSSGVTTIENCSYFGNITFTPTKDVTSNEYVGGIVALGNEDTTVKNCRYGGSVKGVAISPNNFLTYAAGLDCNTGEIIEVTLSDISYWDGE